VKKLLTELACEFARKKITLAVCESCTGGMLGSMITNIPGSSKYFKGGIIAYSNTVKEKLAGVRRKTLEEHGAVSAKAALEMAESVRQKMKADLGVAITGIAGPGGGTRQKPVGLVFIAVTGRRKILLNRCMFKGTRDRVRKKACLWAIRMLEDLLQGN
jgi:PncC family amidohydrolase